MSEVLELEATTVPTQRQSQSAQPTVTAQKIHRLREMEAFFKSLPDRRAEAGLGPVPDNIREMAYEDRDAAQL